MQLGHWLDNTSTKILTFNYFKLDGKLLGLRTCPGKTLTICKYIMVIQTIVCDIPLAVSLCHPIVLTSDMYGLHCEYTCVHMKETTDWIAKC